MAASNNPKIDLIMKKVLFALLFILTCSISGAQDIISNYTTESTVAPLLDGRNSIYKIEYYDPQDVRTFSSFLAASVKFIPAVYTDIMAGNRIPYVILKFGDGDTVYSSIIDQDEINSCIGALDFMMKTEISKQQEADVDLVFKSKDAIKFIAQYSWEKKKWSFAIIQDKYIREPSCLGVVDMIPGIITALTNSNAILKEIMER